MNAVCLLVTQDKEALRLDHDTSNTIMCARLTTNELGISDWAPETRLISSGCLLALTSKRARKAKVGELFSHLYRLEPTRGGELQKEQTNLINNRRGKLELASFHCWL